ncbi:MAG: hypothetical protein ABSE18_02475 [Minisyncoccia bacterium]
MKKIFSSIEGETLVPSADLARRILLRIEKEERLRLMIKTIASGVLLAASVALIVYGAVDVVQEASRSGFVMFASLLFSDSSAVLASFSDFVLSAVESFPVFSAAVLLSGIFVAVWSAAHFIGEMVSMRGRHMFSMLS